MTTKTLELSPDDFAKLTDGIRDKTVTIVEPIDGVGWVVDEVAPTVMLELVETADTLDD